MNAPPAPVVDCELHHPILPVRDVQAAADFYEKKLGFSVGFIWGDPPRTAGLDLGKVSVHLSQAAPNAAGSEVYFVVGDADELHAFQAANGVEVVSGPEDRPWGLRDYTIRDPDGNRLTFGHHLPGTGPPLDIERVDVSVRLEKRLLALLAELAEHKGMSLGLCLEETVLHSFEPVGDAVASPHSKQTHRYIQDLRGKHGIDYDAHDVYRWKEKDPGP